MRKELLIAPWVAIGFTIAIAVLVQPSLARNDSNEKECQEVDARAGLMTTVCSSRTGNGWRITVKTHNVSGLGKGFSTRCLPGTDEEIAASLEAFRLDIAPTVTVQRFVTVDSRERPKVDCKSVRIGDNFSDEPEMAFSRGLKADEQGDTSTALLLWKPMAEQGDFDLQFRLGKMYVFGQGVKQDYGQAYKWFQLAANQGHSGAEGYLGALYVNGDGVQADEVVALKWIRLAAEHGDTYGQHVLGELYEKGNLGLPQDHVQAVKWYRLAAEQGDASGQNRLGFAYEMGHGVQRDYYQAVKWYRLAVDQDHATAQNNLGYAFEHGQGVPQDYAEALKLYRLSAEHGDPDGQRSLGHMYESGLGVPRDYVKAYMWFSLAFAQLQSSGPEWRERAENDRNRVAVNMTPSQIVEAERVAGEWKPSK